MTGEQWDARWWDIFNDLVWEQGHGEDDATKVIADRECVEQFGERPEDEVVAS